MPSASANIIAKFIAQMETGTRWLIRTSEPAEATSPARVRISGSPAATSAPKASTRIASVIGQETISDFSIADRLASLKSDHSSEAPVGLTSTRVVERSWSGALEVVGRPDHLVGVRARAGQEHRGGAVLAEGGAGLRLDHVGDARVRLEHRGGLGQDLLAGSGGDRAVGGVHDDLDRGGGVAAEVLLGELAGGDGVGPVGLPAGPRQLGLDPRREHAEADDQQEPDSGGDPGVVAHPHPEAAQRAGAVADLGMTARRGLSGGFSSSCWHTLGGIWYRFQNTPRGTLELTEGEPMSSYTLSATVALPYDEAVAPPAQPWPSRASAC